MKTIAISLLLFLAAALFGTWHLANNSLDTSEEPSAFEALIAASDYAKDKSLPPPRYVVRQVQGTSNSIWGGHKRGYVILDTQYQYEYLGKGMYVVRNDGDKRVFHPIRAKEGEYWIMEGDGNNTYDKELLTPANFEGVAVDSKIWRY